MSRAGGGKSRGGGETVRVGWRRSRRGGRNTHANVRLLGTARSVAPIWASALGARGGDRGRARTFMIVAPSLEMGDALIVVDGLRDREDLRADRAERGGEAVSPEEIQKGRGGSSTEAHRDLGRGSGGATHQGGADGVDDRHARVDVRSRWPLPWLVSVPSRGAIGALRRLGRAGGRRGVSQIALSKIKMASRGSVARAAERRSRGGTPRRETYDHLPVGHLHERPAMCSPRWRTVVASAVRTHILSG